MRPERHPDEADRLEALRAYEILDTPREAEFDDLVNLASRICETPVALVTLLDADRQWFKAAIGVDVPERPYEESLCAHAILQRGLTEVGDLTRDPRFADNAVVAGEPHLRFYAGVPLETPAGLPVGTFCVIDVRPRVLTEVQRDALRVLGRQAMTQMELRRRVRQGEAERRAVQRTLDRAEIGTWRYDVATGEIEGNERANHFYNVRGQVPLAQVREAMHPEDQAAVARAHADAIRAGGRYEAEYRVTGADGQERWILARGDVEKGPDGRPARLSGVSIDITERRRAEAALDAERDALDATLGFAGVATWAWEVGTDAVRTNRLLRTFFGIPADETRDLPLFEFLKAIHPDDRERSSAEIAAALTGAPLEMEYRVLDAAGAQRWVLSRGRLLDDATTLAGVLVDVTARKAAEAALEAERVQFRRLLDEVPGHVVTVRGPELRYDFANRAFLGFLGRGDDFLGQTVEEAWPAPPDHVAMLRNILATGETASGTEVPMAGSLFDFVFQPLRESDGSVGGVFVHSLDVTEKVRAREALLRAEERFRVAQETTPDAFAIVEPVRDEGGAIVDFRFVYVNAAIERISGDTREDLVGASYLQKRPESRATGLFDAYVGVVETGESVSREFATEHRGLPLYLRLTAVPVGDGVAISFSDITDRRRAEEALREAVEARTKELREAFEEAERFNYSISHDLRTPLRAIAATSQMLIEEAGPELAESHRELLERQSHNARRLGILIDQLLRLSRLGRIEMARNPLDLTALARSVVAEIVQAGDAPCAVEVQEGMRAEGDPALVRLVFANLIGNACKFSAGAGTVRVFQEGEAFAVSDEGPGFDMRHAAKIFQPFERLVADREFAGTGIGLANVERIVRRHGGRVWAESEPGQGATFRFTLGSV